MSTGRGWIQTREGRILGGYTPKVPRPAGAGNSNLKGGAGYGTNAPTQSA